MCYWCELLFHFFLNNIDIIDQCFVINILLHSPPEL